MTNRELMPKIRQMVLQEPKAFIEWFDLNARDIEDEVCTIAKVDGIEKAFKETKRLYVAFLMACRKDY